MLWLFFVSGIVRIFCIESLRNHLLVLSWVWLRWKIHVGIVALSLWWGRRDNCVVWLSLSMVFDHALLLFLKFLEGAIIGYQVIEAGIVYESIWPTLEHLRSVVCFRILWGNISRGTVGCLLLVEKSIPFYRSVPLRRVSERLMRTLAFIINFLKVFKNIAFFLKCVCFPSYRSRYHQPLLRSCSIGSFLIL